MFRIIGYVLMFFLGYKYLSRIFGKSFEQNRMRVDDLNNTKSGKTPEDKNDPAPKKGEYIDYEEVE